MTREEMLGVLVRALDEVSSVLDNGNIRERLAKGADVAIEELELSSLVTLDWGLAIETAINIEIDAAELTAFYTLNELAAHLAQRTS